VKVFHQELGTEDGMRTVLKFWLGVALLAEASVLPGRGQVRGASYPQPQNLVSSGMELSQCEIVREIDDPHTGGRWLLARDPVHPGGPGRLVLAGGVRITVPRPGAPIVEPPHPVIHAGDRLVVEENTTVVEARLEAVALGPAAIGSPLDVRLKIGGTVVRAVALAPGRAAFLAEARP
jgi:hypothetical protein